MEYQYLKLDEAYVVLCEVEEREDDIAFKVFTDHANNAFTKTVQRFPYLFIIGWAANLETANWLCQDFVNNDLENFLRRYEDETY